MSATNKRPAWFLLTQHWLSLLGVALVGTALISWLFVLPQQIRGHVDNPYLGIVVFLALPAIFFAGLLLIPVGAYLSRRQIGEGLAGQAFDRKAALQRIAWIFGATTLLNILIGTQVTYRAVKHMETTQFCGASCHTMNPELAAFQNSPHSRLECVECHVAPGAGGWVESKTSGIRQLVETVLKTAPKPIPSAMASNRLVPAKETCENCHWPGKFSGVRVRVFSKYADDEVNTRSETVLLMLVGEAGSPEFTVRTWARVFTSVMQRPIRSGRLFRGSNTGTPTLVKSEPSPLQTLRRIPPRRFHNLTCNAWTVITARRTPSSCQNGRWTRRSPWATSR